MSDQTWLDGTLEVLKEAVEGGPPGQGTAFLDGTKADGGGNHGLLATLDKLSAAQASDPAVLGLSVAAHMTYHMEVVAFWANGERGPFDWKGSFEPGTVDDAGWQTLQVRVQAAYTALLEVAHRPTDWDDAEEDAAGGVAGALAHLTYHLGAIRQLVKLV